MGAPLFACCAVCDAVTQGPSGHCGRFLWSLGLGRFGHDFVLRLKSIHFWCVVFKHNPRFVKGFEAAENPAQKNERQTIRFLQIVA